jgi:hypothetical protein
MDEEANRIRGAIEGLNRGWPTRCGSCEANRRRGARAALSSESQDDSMDRLAGARFAWDVGRSAVGRAYDRTLRAPPPRARPAAASRLLRKPP